MVSKELDGAKDDLETAKKSLTELSCVTIYLALRSSVREVEFLL